MFSGISVLISPSLLLYCIVYYDIINNNLLCDVDDTSPIMLHPNKHLNQQQNACTSSGTSVDTSAHQNINPIVITDIHAPKES